jgi:hypothetical protein
MSETPQGYQGPLPPNYVQSSTPQTPNLGLTLTGIDPILAYNLVLIDNFAAGGGGGSTVHVNSATIASPINFNNTTPAAPGGSTNVTWQVSGSNVSAYFTGFSTSDFRVNSVDVSDVPVNVQGGSNILVSDLGTGIVQWDFTGTLANSNAGGAGLALGSYNATTGNFTTVSVGTGTVTSVALTMPSIFSVGGSPVTTSGTLAVTLATETANTVWAGPTTGAATTPTFRALVTADLPAGTGTVTSFSAGTLSPLFTTSVATATTTPALSFSLSNAAGGTLFGNNTTGSAAPAYTTAPVLGIPGTSTGTIALASVTASGKFTITAPSSSATPTLTLPTTSNVLAGQFAGDGVVLSSTLAVASAAGTVTAALANAAGGTILGNPTTTSAAPSYTIAPVLGIPGTSTGTIALASSTASGKYTITAPANAATPTLTLPTGTGTFAITASSPIVLNATTGNLTAPTAVTSAASLTSNAIVLGAGSQAVATNTAFITNGTTTLTIGIAGGGNGILALSGNTSGTATFTAPTTAGTSTNAVVTSNVMAGPNGSAAACAYSFSGHLNAGMHDSTNLGFPTFASGGTNQFIIGTSGVARFSSGSIIGWSSNTDATAAASDTGFSRLNAASVALGNGTASDTTGSLSLNTIIKYGGSSTIGQGVASEIVLVDLTAQTAAIAATNLTASAPRTGMYRITMSATITTAATTSSVLGGTNGFQIGFTSPTDSVAKTTVAGNSVTSAANTTGTAIADTITVYAKTGTAISYQFDYTSIGGTSMVYELHLRLEAL